MIGCQLTVAIVNQKGCCEKICFASFPVICNVFRAPLYEKYDGLYATNTG